MRTTKVDGTIPVPALLHDTESFVTNQDNVGLYEGTQKLPDYQNGSVHLTSHRLFYIDALKPLHRSFHVNLQDVGSTEYYAGFITSSAKVTLFAGGSLSVTASSSSSSTTGVSASTEPTSYEGEEDLLIDTWVCPICSNRNNVGINVHQICALCGIQRDRSTRTLPVPIPSKPRGSAPATSASTPRATSPININISNEGEGGQSVACPSCTFLNHPSLSQCEMCSTTLPMNVRKAPAWPPSSSTGTSPYRSVSSSPYPASSLRSAVSRPTTPGPSDPDFTFTCMKVSFRKGGERQWYDSLKQQLFAKSWLDGRTIKKSPRPSGEHKSGIQAILENADLDAQRTDEHMIDALRDLQAFMAKAKEMVAFASSLNAKLLAEEAKVASGSDADDVLQGSDADIIRASMATLGLPTGTTAVTLDMVKDDQEWVVQLAKELGGFLQNPNKDGVDKSKGQGIGGRGLLAGKGIVGLDQVWAVWNRARGVALIPPTTFLQSLEHLPTHTNPPIQLRRFNTGLMVLHTPEYTHTAFSARVVSSISLSGAKTGVQIAAEEGLSVGLAEEMILAVEDDGEILRDDVEGSMEIRWWPNVMRTLDTISLS